MDITQWLSEFRELHERWRRGTLCAGDATTYLGAREELARALLSTQQRSPNPGEPARRSLRVARALQVTLDTADQQLRAMTVDLSSGGFSALLARPPPQDGEMKCTLRLPGSEPLDAAVTVASAKQQPGNVRVDFEFRRLSGEERDRLEGVVFDTVLSQLAR
ncbi:MAG TPA: PilZ domain-containing protein [Anaeromyxobacteraceae bacterium]|nr:PilZ domain-containing protein [Anaeromyxobacteraceae bacterium]